MSNIFTLVSKVQSALDKVEDKSKFPSLLKTLDIDFQIKAKFFDLNAQTFASGKIDLETSQYLYNKLRDYDHTTLAERVVINEFMASLLKDRIANRT